MIKHALHIAMIVLLSISGFAQQQDLFYQILSEVKNNPQTDIIQNYETQVRNDELLAENLAFFWQEKLPCKTMQKQPVHF
jgi:hypothetical protein